MKKYLRLFVCIGLAGFVIAVWYGALRMAGNASRLRKEAARLEQDLVVLEKERRAAEQEFATLRYPETLERRGKERFNLQRQGEHVVVVLPEERAPQVATTTPGWLRFFRSLLPL